MCNCEARSQLQQSYSVWWGRKEVTVRSHRLDGAVMVAADSGQVAVFVGFIFGAAGWRRTVAPREDSSKGGCAHGPQVAAGTSWDHAAIWGRGPVFQGSSGGFAEFASAAAAPRGRRAGGSDRSRFRRSPGARSPADRRAGPAGRGLRAPARAARRQQRRLGLEAGPVDVVAEQRMADMGEMHPDLVGAAGLQPAGEQARDRLAVGSGVDFQPLPVGDRPRARPAAPPACRAPWGGGRSARRSCLSAGPARPRRRPDRPVPAARSGRGRRTAPTARGARGRSSPPPSGRWYPCPAGARCRGASRRRCPKGSRRNGRSAR